MLLLSRWRAAVAVAVLITAYSANAQSTIGWYNGDRQFLIPGVANWYASSTQGFRVYDDFVVSDGGWTVVGAFSNNSISSASPVTQASWEIRSGVAQGTAGTLVASGISAATQTYNATTQAHKIQVDNLNVPLGPGRYWLNVAPVGQLSQQSYLAATKGANAIGTPPGNNGNAFNAQFAPITATGSGGTSSDFSQGVLISGGAPNTPPQPPQPPQPPVADQWKANLAVLVQQMLALHGMPLPGIGIMDFVIKAVDLYNQIPSLSDPEIRTRMQALVASIGDAHTDIGWPSPAPFRMLPLSFYWFDDGIYVTGAAAQYQNLLGGKVLWLGQTSIEDATRTLSALVSNENGQWPKKRIPQMELPNADFLFGMGLISSIDSASFQVQTASGEVVTTDIQSFGPGQLPRVIPLPAGDLPLYRQHQDRNYWATVIDGGATLYFQYNSCMEDPKQPSADFFAELAPMMASEKVQRIVLDMRLNSGGFTSILSPWIDEIQKSRFNQRGRLYVIVGRATFSAAMEATNHLHDRTNAIFVGEPTGAKPQFQLRQGDFQLPYMGIKVSYSNGIEKANDPGPTMIPDIQTGLAFADYMNGVDPALDAILAIPPPQP